MAWQFDRLWTAHNLTADIRPAVRAAIEAFRHDWWSSQFHRQLANEHYDREAMMAGEWHD